MEQVEESPAGRATRRLTLDDDLPAVLTVEQTAQVLGISRGLAFAGVRASEIPHTRIGRRILISRDALLDLLLLVNRTT